MGKWRFDFTAALAAGLIILFLGALMGQMAYLIDWPDKGLEYWLNRYQTFIAAMIAVVSLFGINQQIEVGRRQARASLLGARQAELIALRLAMEIISAIRKYSTFSNEMRAPTGLPGSIPRPKAIAEEEINRVRIPLGLTADPFGILFIQGVLDDAVQRFNDEQMDRENLRVMYRFAIEQCDAALRKVKEKADEIHAQIDASV